MERHRNTIQEFICNELVAKHTQLIVVCVNVMAKTLSLDNIVDG